MPLPSPQTMLAYAGIYRKPYKGMDGKMYPPGPEALAAAEALEHCARIASVDSAAVSQMAKAVQRNGRLVQAISDAITSLEHATNSQGVIDGLRSALANNEAVANHVELGAVGITTATPGGGL